MCDLFTYLDLLLSGVVIAQAIVMWRQRRRIRFLIDRQLYRDLARAKAAGELDTGRQK